MLVIRKEQIETLEAASAGDFEIELAEHIKKFAPKHSESAGEEAVRETARQGIERAKKYGFTTRGPVRFFTELMLMFGWEFDTDPLLPWASGVLNNEAIKLEMERADILHEEMTEYVQAVAGADKKDLIDALRRLSRARLEDYQAQGGNFDSVVKSALKAIYPPKFDYSGEKKIDDVILKGKEEALSRSITSSHGAAVLIVLMFTLGHGIVGDPMYPWISKTLDDESIGEANERAKRLESKSKTYLEQTLKNLES